MDSALIWYGLSLLLVGTVFWAAVWWWLPALFRERDERRDRAQSDERDRATPGRDTRSARAPD